MAPSNGRIWLSRTGSIVERSTTKCKHEAVAILFDADLKPFEWTDLTIGDILNNQFVSKVRVGGKQGTTSIWGHVDTSRT